MIVARHLEDLPTATRAVAIGTFDGLHPGHRTVIRGAVESGLRSAVITFDPHPRSVLGGRAELLITLERRLELLEELGVDDVFVVEFTPQVAAMPPQDWALRFVAGIGAREVFVGQNFRFGRRRSGDPELLRRLGFRVHAIPLLAGTSATRIRELLRSGDVVEATRLLGRRPELEGRLVPAAMTGVGSHRLVPTRGSLIPGSGRYRGVASGRAVDVSIDFCEPPHAPYVFVGGLAVEPNTLSLPLTVELAERVGVADRLARGSRRGLGLTRIQEEGFR